MAEDSGFKHGEDVKRHEAPSADPQDEQTFRSTLMSPAEDARILQEGFPYLHADRF